LNTHRLYPIVLIAVVGLCGATLASAQDGVAKPVITPGSGTYEAGQSVTVTCSTDGASIYYTTDGTTPTTAATPYRAPFVVSGEGVTRTVKAVAVKAGMADSPVTTATLHIRYPPLHLDGEVSTVGGEAYFDYPGGITGDGTNLYVVDTFNNTIRMMTPGSGRIIALAGHAGPNASVDGIGEEARFNNPQDITGDGRYLYVTDTHNNTIRRIEIATATITTIAGTSGVRGHADGTGTNATFNIPAGITTDGTSLYVVDSGNNTVRRIEIGTWKVTTVAGSPGSGGWADGVGKEASFYQPDGITTDGRYLYVVDQGNSIIRRIDPATGRVRTIAGTANETGTADGIGAAARFYKPGGITTDGKSLYVTDTFNHTVRVIDIASGKVATLAGEPRVRGARDGNGSTATFYRPTGITYDGNALYVVDARNDTVRKIK